MKSKAKKKTEKLRFKKGYYSVVKFLENKIKLFECIPDLWFYNEEKTLCYWPPKSKKSVTLRAMNQDEPEEDWIVYDCELISEGHATYAIGCTIARDKASQRYNTSSADEHIKEATFRREHPGLIHRGEKCFESVFATAKDIQSLEMSQTKTSDRQLQATSNVTGNKECEAESNEQNHVQSPAISVTSKSRCRSQSGTSVVQSADKCSEEDKTHSEDNVKLQRSRRSRSRSRSSHFQQRNDYSEQRSNHSRQRNHHSPLQVNNSQSPKNNFQGFTSPFSGRSQSISCSEYNCRSRSTSNSKSNRRSKSNYRSQSKSHSRSNSRSISTNCSQFKRRSISNSRSPSNNHSPSNKNSPFNSRSPSKSSSISTCRSRFNSYSKFDIRNSCSRSQRNNDQNGYRTRSRSSHSQSSRNCSESRSKNHDLRNFSRKKDNNYQSSVSRSSQLTDENSQTMRNMKYSVVKGNRENSARRHVASKSGSYQLDRPNSSNVKRHGAYHQQEEASAKNHVKHQGNVNPKNNFSALPVSPHTRNRLRVEKMYRAHQQQRANRTIVSENVKIISSANPSSRQKNGQQQMESPESLSLHSSDYSKQIQILLKEVRELKNIVNKNDRRFVESDRRLTRLEVTVNKIFIVLGDVSNAINVRMLLGNTLPRDDKPPKGFYPPKLPIIRLKELHILNKDFKNREFFDFLVSREKEFCCYSNATDTATMTSYLRRFIAADVRASIVLKDLRGQNGKTLYHDFYNVYQFLIETMKAGYRIKNKIITNNDVHVILRTVWGRSKQTAIEELHKRRR